MNKRSSGILFQKMRNIGNFLLSPRCLQKRIDIPTNTPPPLPPNDSGIFVMFNLKKIAHRYFIGEDLLRPYMIEPPHS